VGVYGIVTAMKSFHKRWSKSRIGGYSGALRRFIPASR